MENNTDISYFKPLLEKFCETTIQNFDCGYPYGPFIPYTMPEYINADIRFFYMGRDTYGWVKKKELISDYKSGNLENYLIKNSSSVDVEKMLEWKNNAGSFWTMVAKLHLFIRTGQYHDDITIANQNDKKILNEIGYGNLNAIECPYSLQTEGIWKQITSQEKYWKIKEAGHVFEKIKLILEAYAPDYIFIFNWEERDDIFEGLDFKWHKEYYKDGIQAVYTIKGYKTKIIWSTHPRRYSFLQTNMKEMINNLSETIKTIHTI